MKLELLLNNSKDLSFLPCVHDAGAVLVPFPYLEDYTNSFAKIINRTISDDISTANISSKTFEIAAEMFIYLNLCPKMMTEWINFYARFFKDSPPNIIVLTLNRILKIGHQKKDRLIVELTKKVWSKVIEIFAFQIRGVEELTRTEKLSKESLGEYSFENSSLLIICNVLAFQ